jgi:hypothetical protein
MKNQIAIISLIFSSFLFLASTCEPIEIDPVCEGGYPIEAYAEDPFYGTTEHLTDPFPSVFAGHNLYFETSYEGDGEVCWYLTGPCIFTSSATPSISLTPYDCEGDYKVSLEITETLAKYCDERFFHVTPVGFDTIPVSSDTITTMMDELCF